MMEKFKELIESGMKLSDVSGINSTIATIESYISDISQQVEEAISNQYDPVAMVMKDTDAIYDEAKITLQRIEELNVTLKKESGIRIVSTEETQKSLMSQMLKSETMISVLHQLCQCHELIEESDELMTELERAEKLSEARDKISTLVNMNCTSKIISVLQEELDAKVFDIFKTVSKWYDHVNIKDRCVTYDDETLTNLDRSAEILNILAKNEIIKIASTFADDFNRCMLVPLIENNLECKFIDNATENTNKITLVECSNPLSACFDEVLNLIMILDDKIIPSDNSFREVFWSKVYGTMVDSLKINCIDKSIPDQLDELKALVEDMIPAVNMFEERLECRELFPQFDRRLSKYISDYYLLFSKKYQERFYTKARNILMSRNEDTVAVSTVLDKPKGTADKPIECSDPCSPLSLTYPETDKILRLPEFQVTNKAVKLSNLVVSILEEATTPDLPQSATVFLCQLARNITEFYQIPSFDPFDIPDSPQKCAQKFCDMWFLAHSIVWKSIELKDKIPTEVTFIDVVYHLRTAGTHLLKLSYDSLIDKIKDLLDQTKRLGAVDTDNQNMIIEMAFVQIIALLNQHTTIWKSVLPKSEYTRLLNLSINTTLELIIQETFSLGDISVKHSACLSTNFKLILEQLEKVRGDSVEHDSHLPTKFKLLSNIMDDSLVKIVDDWESGLLSEFFKANEVQRLARAIFQNTDKNAGLWNRIRGDIV